MKLQHETVEYYIKDAQLELRKILSACKKRDLFDGDMLPLMEHALHMLNVSFNFRHKSREEVCALPFDEWEKGTLPPKEIFADCMYLNSAIGKTNKLVKKKAKIPRKGK
jgi:hypothetical protein